MAFPAEYLSRGIVTTMVACVSLPLLVWAVIGEVNPLAGDWNVDRVLVDGKEVPSTDAGIFMEISRGYAVIETSRWCGNMPRNIIAEGKMIVKGSVIALHEEKDFVSHDLSHYPSAELVRLPGGNLSYTTNLGDGKLTTLEFVRTKNKSTLLDLVGWQ